MQPVRDNRSRKAAELANGKKLSSGTQAATSSSSGLSAHHFSLSEAARPEGSNSLCWPLPAYLQPISPAVSGLKCAAAASAEGTRPFQENAPASSWIMSQLRLDIDAARFGHYVRCLSATDSGPPVGTEFMVAWSDLTRPRRSTQPALHEDATEFSQQSRQPDAFLALQKAAAWVPVAAQLGDGTPVEDLFEHALRHSSDFSSLDRSLAAGALPVIGEPPAAVAALQNIGHDGVSSDVLGFLGATSYGVTGTTEGLYRESCSGAVAAPGDGVRPGRGTAAGQAVATGAVRKRPWSRHAIFAVAPGSLQNPQHWEADDDDDNEEEEEEEERQQEQQECCLRPLASFKLRRVDYPGLVEPALLQQLAAAAEDSTPPEVLPCSVSVGTAGSSHIAAGRLGRCVHVHDWRVSERDVAADAAVDGGLPAPPLPASGNAAHPSTGQLRVRLDRTVAGHVGFARGPALDAAIGGEQGLQAPAQAGKLPWCAASRPGRPPLAPQAPPQTQQDTELVQEIIQNLMSVAPADRTFRTVPDAAVAVPAPLTRGTYGTRTGAGEPLCAKTLCEATARDRSCASAAVAPQFAAPTVLPLAAQHPASSDRPAGRNAVHEALILLTTRYYVQRGLPINADERLRPAPHVDPLPGED